MIESKKNEWVSVIHLCVLQYEREIDNAPWPAAFANEKKSSHAQASRYKRTN